MCAVNPVVKLAVEFSKCLLACIGQGELSEAARLNAAESNRSVCHTHDFCDSNQVMLDAMESLKVSCNDLVVSDAWNLAYACGFFLQSGKFCTITPQWQDKGDDGLVFEVTEDNGDRLFICVVNTAMKIRPTQIVMADMVERISIC